MCKPFVLCATAVAVTCLVSLGTWPNVASANQVKGGVTLLRITDRPVAPWDTTNRSLPRILIVNDLVLLPDPVLYRTQQFLPKMISGPVSIEQRVAAGAEIETAGMLLEGFDVGNSAGPWPPGTIDTVIDVTVSGVDRSILVRGLGIAKAELPKMSAAQLTNRALLTSVISSLTAEPRWNLRGEYFHPTKYSAWGIKSKTKPTNSVASTFDLSAFSTNAVKCIVVPAAQAEAMPPTTQKWLSWKGGFYKVVMRPVLPREIGCSNVR